MAGPRITRVFGAVNMGSFRISAIVAGISEMGDLVVLGSGHRASQGIKRGYVTDMSAATYAIRDAIDRAEKMADTSVQSVWIGCSGAGLASQVVEVDTDMGGRRIEQEDIDQLLYSARDAIRPDGRMVLHAQPAQYRLDGAHGVGNPCGLHAERLGVNIHVMLADGAPIRNLTEAVQSAHLDVEAVVGSPIASGQACLSPEERDLGVALVEFGAEVTNVAVYSQGLLKGLASIAMGSADITDAIASAFGIRRFQAERLKCVNGSAIASPADHREMIPVNAPGDGEIGPVARHADDKNRIPRAELVAVITGQLGILLDEVNKALKALHFNEQRGKQVVFTGGGAELVGLADYAQAALGKPVRIGRVPHLTGLAETHLKPGFATLAGLVLYAAADPIDIRSLGSRHQMAIRYGGMGMVSRVYRALKEYF
ncbi:cell division protein FtsA [Novosphingobium album (ex Liu et al. 2023)]|uniref:Cell division protein FtsA n=1 Tax=Novosphingobium album (ex Liu et al. 2023) TaxID=3031130 RepID=A0ABT5WK25_9SPHN|nr:cell division protein FtsA [Novosphingobium album (ex Liu et al. 2023)]MDE8650402.1 cell division protein FtsA [Novosphingobium album (ex Liu et al. 2023)]